MNKENFRFYIKVRTALDVQPTIIHDEAPSFRTVARWSQWFCEGREEIDNDDPYITVEELQAQTGLSHGTIQRIISDHLNFRKITARYIPKHLTDSQRAERA